MQSQRHRGHFKNSCDCAIVSALCSSHKHWRIVEGSTTELICLSHSSRKERQQKPLWSQSHGSCMMSEIRAHVLFLVAGHEWLPNCSVFFESHWSFINIPGDQTQNEKQEQRLFLSLSLCLCYQVKEQRSVGFYRIRRQSLIACFWAQILALFWTQMSIQICFTKFVSDI